MDHDVSDLMMTGPLLSMKGCDMTIPFDLSPLLFAAGQVSIVPTFSILLQAVLFIAAYQVLRRVMFPPVLNVILERQKKIEQATKELVKLEEEGQQMELEYQEKIREARLKAQEIVSQARKEASEEEHTILDEAKQKSAKELYENTNKLEQNRQQIVDQFDKESEEMASEIASKLLGRSISTES